MPENVLQHRAMIIVTLNFTKDGVPFHRNKILSGWDSNPQPPSRTIFHQPVKDLQKSRTKPSEPNVAFFWLAFFTV